MTAGQDNPAPTTPTATASAEFVRYLNVRSAYGASFAPDGQHISFLTDITGVASVIARARRWSTMISGFKSPCVLALTVSSSGTIACRNTRMAAGRYKRCVGVAANAAAIRSSSACTIAA